MAFTLGNLLIASLRALGQLNDYTATSGSTTTAVLPDITDVTDDEFKGGTFFVVSTTDGLAPNTEFARISAYNATTTTVTFGTLTAAVGANDRVAISQAFYPMETCIQCANDAMRALGDLVIPDESTLTTNEQETEYTWAVAWKRRPPLKVQMQTETNTNDNQWRDVNDLYVVPAPPGTAGKLIFRDYFAKAGMKIRVLYEGMHPELTAYSSPISESITPELAVAATCEKLLEWQTRRTQGNDPFLVQTLNDAKATTERMRQMYPIWKIKRNNRPFVMPKASY